MIKEIKEHYEQRSKEVLFDLAQNLLYLISDNLLLKIFEDNPVFQKLSEKDYASYEADEMLEAIQALFPVAEGNDTLYNDILDYMK